MADEKVTDEELSALLDRELPPERMAELESRIASDPALQRRAENLHSLDMAFREAMSEPLREPVPERLIAAVGDARMARPAAARFRIGVWTLRLASAAIVLAIGVGVGSRLPLMESTGSGGAVTVAVLERLQTTPTGEQRSFEAGDERIQVMPLLSFRSAGGEICRQYEQLSAAAGPGQSGVGIACTRGNGWRIAGYWPDAGGASAGQGDDVYRPASGQRDDRADRFLGSIMQGAPLSPGEEAAMIESGWRSE